ncbi:MAG: TlpA family protein disulfide reductase [Syntrophaceae bacterium]|nr:TlpA family protein disulfide reductase [Syntrophaceae bacterium]
MKLFEEFKGTDLVLLKVAIKDKEEDVKKYRSDFKISFPIMIDDGKVANSYGVWSHPETFFINREGKIVGRVFRDKDWTSKSIKNLLQHLLGEKR